MFDAGSSASRRQPRRPASHSPGAPHAAGSSAAPPLDAGNPAAPPPAWSPATRRRQPRLQPTCLDPPPADRPRPAWSGARRWELRDAALDADTLLPHRPPGAPPPDAGRPTSSRQAHGVPPARLERRPRRELHGPDCLVGKVIIALDLKGAKAKPVILHGGWISIAKRADKARPRLRS